MWTGVVEGRKRERRSGEKREPQRKREQGDGVRAPSFPCACESGARAEVARRRNLEVGKFPSRPRTNHPPCPAFLRIHVARTARDARLTYQLRSALYVLANLVLRKVRGRRDRSERGRLPLPKSLPPSESSVEISDVDIMLCMTYSAFVPTSPTTLQRLSRGIHPLSVSFRLDVAAPFCPRNAAVTCADVHGFLQFVKLGAIADTRLLDRLSCFGGLAGPVIEKDAAESFGEEIGAALGSR